VLGHFCTTKIYKEKLAEFSSKTVEGKSEYHRYCVKERRTVIELMRDF
jgi:hypothetical protein